MFIAMVAPGILSSLHPSKTTVWIKKLSEDDLMQKSSTWQSYQGFSRKKVIRGGGEEMGIGGV